MSHFLLKQPFIGPCSSSSHAWTKTKAYFVARHVFHERPTICVSVSLLSTLSQTIYTMKPLLSRSQTSVVQLPVKCGRHCGMHAMIPRHADFEVRPPRIGIWGSECCCFPPFLSGRQAVGKRQTQPISERSMLWRQIRNQILLLQRRATIDRRDLTTMSRYTLRLVPFRGYTKSLIGLLSSGVLGAGEPNIYRHLHGLSSSKPALGPHYRLQLVLPTVVPIHASLRSWRRLTPGSSAGKSRIRLVSKVGLGSSSSSTVPHQL